MKVPISPYPHQHLALSVFWIITILVDVKWHLIVVLIGISLMTNNVEYLFLHLLAIHISSLVRTHDYKVNASQICHTHSCLSAFDSLPIT